eukprot:Sdes_comp20913_c0_seq8m18222
MFQSPSTKLPSLWKAFAEISLSILKNTEAVLDGTLSSKKSPPESAPKDPQLKRHTKYPLPGKGVFLNDSLSSVSNSKASPTSFADSLLKIPILGLRSRESLPTNSPSPTLKSKNIFEQPSHDLDDSRNDSIKMPSSMAEYFQLQVWCIESLSFLICASYEEDSLGVVQQTIPDILEEFLNLSALLEKSLRVITPKYSPSTGPPLFSFGIFSQLNSLQSLFDYLFPTSLTFSQLASRTGNASGGVFLFSSHSEMSFLIPPFNRSISYFVSPIPRLQCLQNTLELSLFRIIQKFRPHLDTFSLSPNCALRLQNLVAGA